MGAAARVPAISYRHHHPKQDLHQMATGNDDAATHLDDLEQPWPSRRIMQASSDSYNVQRLSDVLLYILNR